LNELIAVPGGGSRMPPSQKTIAERMQCIKMKGHETFKVAVRNLEEIARETLAANHLRVEDLDLYVPHQANLRILTAVMERLGLPPEKVMLNLDRYGNTSAASIPIALDEAVRAGRIRDGSLVMLGAFGAGLTWASAMIRW
jgi:3-oxoacyl-[acyl-carrier-protein] synthase-3